VFKYRVENRSHIPAGAFIGCRKAAGRQWLQRVATRLWTPVLSASGGRRPNPDIRARGLLRKLPFMAMRLPGNGGITACDGSLPLGEQYLNLTEQEIDIHWLRQYPVCN
jgi:hypothetical protein